MIPATLVKSSPGENNINKNNEILGTKCSPSQEKLTGQNSEIKQTKSRTYDFLHHRILRNFLIISLLRQKPDIMTIWAMSYVLELHMLNLPKDHDSIIIKIEWNVTFFKYNRLSVKWIRDWFDFLVNGLCHSWCFHLFSRRWACEKENEQDEMFRTTKNLLYRIGPI